MQDKGKNGRVRRILLFSIVVFVFGGVSAQVFAYCSASGGCREYIYTVEVGTINNAATVCDNYTDYTSSHLTTMQVGSSYPITIVGAVAGDPYYGYIGDQLGIWIDWNQDDDFDDLDEEVYTHSAYGYFSTTIIPPRHAALGDTRMRIRLTYVGTLGPCGANAYGEVEDYRITVTGEPEKYGGGSGTSGDPYLIYTAEQLQEVGATPADWVRHFKLMSDIDLSIYSEFNMIGIHNWSSPSVPFMGVFDGNNCTISNFTYSFSGTKQEYIGVFGYVSGTFAEVKNVIVTDCNVDGGDYGVGEGALVGIFGNGLIRNCRAEGGTVRGESFGSGGLIGRKSGGLLTHCYTSVDVTNATGSAGGLVGAHYSGEISYCVSESTVESGYSAGGLSPSNSSGGTITCCSTNATVTAMQQVGGLVGQNTGTISQCYSTSSVTATSNEAGGLIGRCNGGTVSDCYSAGSATSPLRAAGFAGLHWGGTIRRCYASSVVPGGSNSGAFVGFYIEGLYENCFWDTGVCGLPGISNRTDPEVSGLLTLDMRRESTFAGAGWDFVGEQSNGTADIWVIRELLDSPKLACSGYYGGYGTASGPYLIYRPEQMNGIGARPVDWYSHFKLMADLDMSMYHGIEYNVIGDSFGNEFRGSFDGNDHVIRNFTYVGSGVDYCGLFGRVYNSASVIKDLGLISPTVDVPGSFRAGSLVADLFEGKVVNCWAEDVYVGGRIESGGLVGGAWYGELYNCHTSGQLNAGIWVGGLAGSLHSGVVSSCSSSCSVIGVQEVGGLIGTNAETVINCYATGDVEASDRSAGGLIGDNSGLAARCYSTGNATCDDETGGLVGRNMGDINDCYAMGDASGTWDTGGVVGLNWNGGVRRSSSAGIASGFFEVGGVVGRSIDGTTIDSFWDLSTGSPDNGIGIGLSSVAMRTQTSFTGVGWDFVGESGNGSDDYWRMCTDDVEYPLLWWQFDGGDFRCPDGVNGVDFAYFANWWMEEDCASKDNCGGADVDLSGVVDWRDLKILCELWLN